MNDLKIIKNWGITPNRDNIEVMLLQMLDGNLTVRTGRLTRHSRTRTEHA